MAELEQKEKTASDIYVAPVIMFFRTLWLFLDVATLMVRLLFRTLFPSNASTLDGGLAEARRD